MSNSTENTQRPEPAVGQIWETTGNWGEQVEIVGLGQKQYAKGVEDAVQIASYPAAENMRGARKGVRWVKASRFRKNASTITDQGFIFIR